MRRACIALALVSLAAAAPAQENVDRVQPPSMDELLDGMALEGPARTPGQGDSQPIDLRLPCDEIQDEEVRAACWRAYAARLEYYESGLRHRSRVFAWQHLSSRIIFVVVLGLVGFGVLLAWMQFRGRARPAAQGATPAEPTHEIELSAKGFKVSSPVLGVVILGLSLGFFYLYLRYVYPISEIF